MAANPLKGARVLEYWCKNVTRSVKQVFYINSTPSSFKSNINNEAKF